MKRETREIFYAIAQSEAMYVSHTSPMNLGVMSKSFPFVESWGSKVRDTWKQVTRNSVKLTEEGGVRQGNPKNKQCGRMGQWDWPKREKLLAGIDMLPFTPSSTFNKFSE